MPRAVMLMFDSLNRDILARHADWLPNFSRLAERTVSFERFYAGSLPCMPARRELHTGRPNFLHRSWGPLEPFDDSVPEILDEHGVHSHLVTDHGHYWEDGGANYHTRYTTWEGFRGQEGDPWKADVDGPLRHTSVPRIRAQDRTNRDHQRSEADHSQTRTLEAGLEFLHTNSTAEDWFLQLEFFDPHEPFFTYDRYRQDIVEHLDAQPCDWPSYARVTEDAATQSKVRAEYLALVRQCDHSLGRILDAFDTLGLWDDTMLIVNTDHGYLLGEHGWWAKTIMPWYEELVRLPFFLHSPQLGGAGSRSELLLQTIDIPATLLAHFGCSRPVSMLGRDIVAAQIAQVPPRPWALFGVHGGHVNVTDGRYTYMRSCATASNEPLEEFTLMPAHMRRRFSAESLAEWRPAPPFDFTRGIRTMQMTVAGDHSWFSSYPYGTLIFDLVEDPGQHDPLVDDELELQLIELLLDAMKALDSPVSQYQRLGLPAAGRPGREHVLARRHHLRALNMTHPLPLRPHSPLLDRPLAELLEVRGIAKSVREMLGEYVDAEWLSAPSTMSLWQMAKSGLLSADVIDRLDERFTEAGHPA